MFDHRVEPVDCVSGCLWWWPAAASRVLKIFAETCRLYPQACGTYSVATPQRRVVVHSAKNPEIADSRHRMPAGIQPRMAKQDLKEVRGCNVESCEENEGRSLYLEQE